MLTSAVLSRLSSSRPDADRVIHRLFASSRGDRLRPAVADLRERPGSAALAQVLRAQILAALETDPQLATDLASMIEAPTPAPARYNVSIGNAQNVQVGDRNVQHNVYGGAPVRSLTRNVILTVFSNPSGTDGLRLDEEYRAITQAVQAGSYRDRLRVVSAPAARHDELSSNIQHHRPVVVHVGVHGTAAGELVFADAGGRPFEVSPSALADLFAIHAGTVRCVVLNGCFTKRLADAVAGHGPCVVGTWRAIADALAIEFAGGFYTALANGRRFDEAFSDARNRLDLGDRAGGDAIVFAAGRGGGYRAAID